MEQVLRKKTMIFEVLIFDDFLESFPNRIFHEKGRLTEPGNEFRSPRRGGGRGKPLPQSILEIFDVPELKFMDLSHYFSDLVMKDC